MEFRELDTVALAEDLSAHNLKKGDIGAIVAIYPDGTVEVEFVTASGHTQAIVSLPNSKIRALGPNDIPAVRNLDAA